MTNTLYFGDNLDILRERIPDEVADLVYLDPPFNSHAQYNLIFDRPNSDGGSAQAGAFRDTWVWGEDAEWSYDEMMRIGGPAARLIDALRGALRESDMMAYLVMMAVRLYELRRALKPTGSLYLHCDPTASHYLKTLMDAIFGTTAFTNEIVWRRTTPKGLASSRFAANHDVILFYRRGESFTWSSQYMDYSKEYLDRYNLIDAKTGRKFQATSLLNPNPDRPNLTYEFHGHTRVWRWTRERMLKAERDGLIYFPAKGGVPREKRFLDEQQGVPVSSVWTDIPPVNAVAQERLGYPTQKPLALLRRIILASSKEGDVVLDPFCGCGTTIEAAQQLKRQWIGVDVAVHAIKVIEARLAERFKKSLSYQIEGMPRDFASAVKLAERDKYQFQWWANYLFNPHTLREQKRGADRGIDGELFFPNGPGRPWGRMLTSVKGGETVGPAPIREFARVLDREKAELGLFIFLHHPTRAMVAEASSVGFSRTAHGQIPRLQLVSIEEWFKGKAPLLPPMEHLPSAAMSRSIARRTPLKKRPDVTQPELPLSFTGGKLAENITRYLNPGMVVRAS